MADALASCSHDFWGEVKHINQQPGGHSLVSTLDGVSGHVNISNVWSDKLQSLLNSSCNASCDVLCLTLVSLFLFVGSSIRTILS